MEEIQRMESACRLIIEEIIKGKVKTRDELENVKRQVCKDFKLKKFISNSTILKYATKKERKVIEELLRKKPTRTISGVAIVAVMCQPHPCPHGRCLYCPESKKAPPKLISSRFFLRRCAHGNCKSSSLQRHLLANCTLGAGGNTKINVILLKAVY